MSTQESNTFHFISSLVFDNML